MIKGKGIYAWQLDRCEDGDMGRVVENLKKAGMTHVMPKIADGNYEYLRNKPYLENLVTLCHREGIQVIPFHFVYGRYPTAEAVRVIQELRKYPYDGLVINAEGGYKTIPNPAIAAEEYCRAVRREFPDLMIALSTYRFPSLHREFPFKAFLKYCDINMPQVYWMWANGTVPGQLDQTIAEYMDITDVPMIPTGAAFKEHGWAAIPEDQKIFIEQVKDYDIEGCNWWEYRYAFEVMPELGQAIIDTPFDVEDPTPVDPTPEPPAGTFWAICTASYSLSIRSTPEMATGNIVGYLMNDQKKIVTEQSGIWWKIGNEQWVSSNYMKRLSDPVEPEEPEEPETIQQQLEEVKTRLDIIEDLLEIY